MAVWLIKPATDDRDGVDIVASRIGLSARAQVIYPDSDPLFELARRGRTDVIICDECQFLTPAQVDSLREIVDEKGIPVLCFGLATDFTTHMFPGSKRLFEIAESISEIKSVCKCGAKATVNARLDDNGNVVFRGEQVCLGGNDRYVAMCRKCWLKKKAEQEAKGLYL